jgi:WD40 repeat protein
MSQKRNNKVQEYTLQQSTKITCAQFSSKYKEIFIAGDTRNQLSIWKKHKEKPQIILTGNQQPLTVQTEISCLQLSLDESSAFSGSNRGIINIWDLASTKLSCSLKGHSTSINCLSRFSEERASHWLVSGAYDGSIKLWDTRTKNALCSFKSPSTNTQIASLDTSPDGHWVVSGNQDGLIKIWDLKM